MSSGGSFADEAVRVVLYPISGNSCRDANDPGIDNELFSRKSCQQAVVPSRLVIGGITTCQVWVMIINSSPKGNSTLPPKFRSSRVTSKQHDLELHSVTLIEHLEPCLCS